MQWSIKFANSINYCNIYTAAMHAIQHLLYCHLLYLSPTADKYGCELQHHNLQQREKEFPTKEREVTFKCKDAAKNLIFGAII